MLREAFQLDVEAEWVETAVDRVLAAGNRTPDIAEPDSSVVSCSGLIAQIHSEMRASLEQLECYGWGVWAPGSHLASRGSGRGPPLPAAAWNVNFFPHPKPVQPRDFLTDVPGDW